MNDLGRSTDLHGGVREALDRVVSSGWFVHGPEHGAFEQEFAAFVGTAHCVGVGSGTDALELGIRALTVGRRGTVLTAANAGGYTSVAAWRAGLTPSYADVDPATMNLDVDIIADILADRDVAVVVVTHLYGRLAEIEKLADICRQHEVPLLEDCAQAVGAERGGKRAGSFGDAAAFSFYPTKNLGGLGDGGAITTDHEDLAGRLVRLRQYGWEHKYVIAETGGRNSRLDELQAAVLRARLPGLPEHNDRRRYIVGRYVRAAHGSSVHVLPADSPAHVAHIAVALADDREVVRQRLHRGGVTTDVHYPVPDHRQVGLAAPLQSLPVTERLQERIFSLPCFPQLTDEEVARVCAGLAGL